MTFLKKLGLIVLKATEIVTGFGPLVTQLVPGDKDDQIVQQLSLDLAQIAEVIAQAEVFGAALGLPGDQKLKAAAPAVAQIVLKSSVLARHEIANPALFQGGCTQIASGMADVLNALKDNVETVNKA